MAPFLQAKRDDDGSDMGLVDGKTPTARLGWKRVAGTNYLRPIVQSRTPEALTEASRA